MKPSVFHFSFAFVLFFALFARENAPTASSRYSSSCGIGYYDSLTGKTVYEYLEQMPRYPGGEQKLLEFFSSKTRLPDPKERQTIFHLTFVVDESGKVVGGRITKKKPEVYTATETYIVNLLDSMPRWQPAVCDNKPAAVLLRMAIRPEYRR